MSLPPVEIPLGAMRFNSDSQKLEYWNGSAWFQIHTFSPNLDGGARGLFMGGSPNTAGKTIEFITIPTAGNATDFGDMADQAKYCSSCASNTRGIVAGGESPSDSTHEEIEFVTIATTGNGTDFGDLTDARGYQASLSNSVRGLNAGGYDGSSALNTIDFVIIATTGNAQDFGDLLSINYGTSGSSDSHGGLS